MLSKKLILQLTVEFFLCGLLAGILVTSGCTFKLCAVCTDTGTKSSSNASVPIDSKTGDPIFWPGAVKPAVLSSTVSK